jgi:hypothetical protein
VSIFQSILTSLANLVTLFAGPTSSYALMPASPSGGTKTTIGSQATKSNQAFRTLALFHLEPANCPEVFWSKD